MGALDVYTARALMVDVYIIGGVYYFKVNATCFYTQVYITLDCNLSSGV